jgi:hypothetical protein
VSANINKQNHLSVNGHAPFGVGRVTHWMFAVLLTLQLLDGHSTLRNPNHTELEANPLITGLAGHLGFFWALLLIKSISVLAIGLWWNSWRKSQQHTAVVMTTLAILIAIHAATIFNNYLMNH